ncbi:MAG: dihydroxyacetone kinase subunit DhaL [Mobiluncus porci]|uniref:dihydroxyacetone kinase subunit DhaL n=1 Tax=Mobiluncus TaxID=2050 RepID=UPI0023EF62D8|nr:MULTISPECIES: dihydroxyacetone kinase subunit DhaL [Mobiluncus]MCI6584672.1 dihydroxyacetone kinase subunit L [Mobiluncus sp.]MDD7542022.1 dihydroxyacetone kinase subunit DhaL [Mobiluncus porci]MDY5747644.1 dihydroxyacetone kinase subunit DhaL [Mobiluncus porci]
MSDFTLETAKAWMSEYARVLDEKKEYLTELDSPIGDADHGTNMARGMKAAIEPANLDQPDLGSLFKKVGLALVSKVGGTSGPLYGTFFMRAGKEAGETTALDGAALSKALHAGLQGVIDRGKAELEDKTMVDAMTPALAAFDKAIGAADLAAASAAAAEAAKTGAEATTPMLAKKGRASYLGERSIGHQDPGATSTEYLFESLAASLA